MNECAHTSSSIDVDCIAVSVLVGLATNCCRPQSQHCHRLSLWCFSYYKTDHTTDSHFEYKYYFWFVVCSKIINMLSWSVIFLKAWCNLNSLHITIESWQQSVYGVKLMISVCMLLCWTAHWHICSALLTLSLSQHHVICQWIKQASSDLTVTISLYHVPPLCCNMCIPTEPPVYGFLFQLITHTHTHPLNVSVRNYPGEPVPER